MERLKKQVDFILEADKESATYSGYKTTNWYKTFEYFKKMQERITQFIIRTSNIERLYNIKSNTILLASNNSFFIFFFSKFVAFF